MASARILIGDMRELLRGLPANSVDSVLTDPPYHLTSIVKRFGATSLTDTNKTGDRARAGADGLARLSRGFMGQTWDGGDVAFQADTWAEALRVLKPGGHLCAFGGTRTYHRLACAIEDSGFEIRDTILWLYGSGFPKSHDVSKGIDKAAGKLAARSKGFNAAGLGAGYESNGGSEFRSDHPDFKPYEPATPEAAQWQGWGTALKPACEPICLARKPLGEKSIAANVLKWGTGALNIDACRIETDDNLVTHHAGGTGNRENWRTGNRPGVAYSTGGTNGRWPANLAHDGSAEVLAGFPETAAGTWPAERGPGGIGNDGHAGQTGLEPRHAEGGSAARFFYCAKAGAEERGDANGHPTVKPVPLMRWLVRLVTPPCGLILDPFAGSGSTGVAAEIEQFEFIGCEISPAYVAIAERRLRDSAGLFAAVSVEGAAA